MQSYYFNRSQPYDHMSVMASRKMFCIIVFTLGLVFTHCAFADELILHNGSRLIGSVVKKEDEHLKLKTDFAGTLDVEWTEVKELSTDKPMVVMLENEEIILSHIIRNSGDVTTIVTRDKKLSRELKNSEVAFINPDSWRTGNGNMFSGLSGHADFALKSQRGNTDKDETDINADLTWRRKNDRFLLFGEMEYDRNDRKKSVDKWRLRGDYNYFVNKKFYIGWGSAISSDDFADLNFRIATGPLAGYQFFESKAMNLNVEAKIMRVHEEFESSTDNITIDIPDQDSITVPVTTTPPDNNYWSAGWSVNFDKYLFNDLFQFYHRQEGLPNLEDADIVWNSWTGLRFPLIKGFVFSTEAKLEYDSGAAEDADKIDTTYRLKFGYQW